VPLPTAQLPTSARAAALVAALLPVADLAARPASTSNEHDERRHLLASTLSCPVHSSARETCQTPIHSLYIIQETVKRILVDTRNRSYLSRSRAIGTMPRETPSGPLRVPREWLCRVNPFPFIIVPFCLSSIQSATSETLKTYLHTLLSSCTYSNRS